MELIKSNIQLARRTSKIEPTGTIGIAAIAGMEVDLNRLKSLFSVASFILAEHDVQALSHLCRMHAQLKSKVMNHFQKLKSISIGSRKPAPSQKINVTSLLESDISILKIAIDKFHFKLFKKNPNKVQLL